MAKKAKKNSETTEINMSDDSKCYKGKQEDNARNHNIKSPGYSEMENEINDFFKEEFERVNYWLSFAEAKNAALIAINIAIMAVVINVFKGAPILCVISSIAHLLSSAFCLASFIPNLSFVPLKKKRKCGYKENNTSKSDLDKVNLLFYGSIAEIGDTGIYYNAVLNKYFLSHVTRSIVQGKVVTIDEAHAKNTATEDLFNRAYDLAEEIVINSQITVNKYAWFNRAVKMDFIGIVLVIVTLVVA